MPPWLTPVGVASALLAVMLLGGLLLFRFCFVKVPSGYALLVHRPGREADVSFTGAVVYPWLNQAELMQITTRTLKVERRSANPLVTKDGVALHATATFVVRVNRHPEDVLKVAQSIGVDRANDSAVIDELFRPKLEQALEAVAGAMRAEDLLSDRMRYQDQVIAVVGTDLNGFHLDDLSIHDVYRADG